MAPRQESTIVKAVEHVPIAGHVMALWHRCTNDDETVALQALNRANNGTAALGVTVAAIASAPATASVGTLVAIGAAGGAVGSVVGNEVQAVSEIIENDVFDKNVEEEGVRKFHQPKQLVTEAAIGGVAGAFTGGMAAGKVVPTGVGGSASGATMAKDGTVRVATGMAKRLPGQTVTQAQLNYGQQFVKETAAQSAKATSPSMIAAGANGAATAAQCGVCSECYGPATFACSRCSTSYCHTCGKQCPC